MLVGTTRDKRAQREQAICDFYYRCNPSFSQVQMSEYELSVMCLSFMGCHDWPLCTVIAHAHTYSLQNAGTHEMHAHTHICVLDKH